MEKLNIDHDLHMVREPQKEFKSMNHLRALRFQAERGDFGPLPISVPKGDLVFRLTDGEIKKYAMQQADDQVKSESKMRQHLAANGDY